MQIVYHIGAHCTDDEAIMNCLLKNAGAFKDEGIRIPGPLKYRKLIRETIEGLGGLPPGPGMRDRLLAEILGDAADVRRLVLYNANFLCVAPQIFDGGQLYPQTRTRLRNLRDLFARDELALFIGLRNPATFVPAVMGLAQKVDPVAYLQGMTPEDIRWSRVVATIRQVLPEVPLTVWCNEDTPFIWAELLREIIGVSPQKGISGGYDLLSKIMEPEGLRNFSAYLRSHPPKSINQKRRIITSFLERYALDAEIEEEIDLPGWDAARVERLTALYAQDVAEIAQMPGVRFMRP